MLWYEWGKGERARTAQDCKVATANFGFFEGRTLSELEKLLEAQGAHGASRCDMMEIKRYGTGNTWCRYGEECFVLVRNDQCTLRYRIRSVQQDTETCRMVLATVSYREHACY